MVLESGIVNIRDFGHYCLLLLIYCCSLFTSVLAISYHDEVTSCSFHNAVCFFAFLFRILIGVCPVLIYNFDYGGLCYVQCKL